MKHFILIAKIIGGIAVLMAVLLVSHLANEKLFGESTLTPEKNQDDSATSSAVAKPKPMVVYGESINELSAKLKKAAKKSEYEPGQKAFEKACELLAGGAYYEAEVKLSELIAHYPNAPAVPEARRIIGQRKVDRYLGDSKSGGKIFHKVVAGDSFYKIAKKYNTSLSNIMVLNGLFDFKKLHKGEEILVMPLLFNLVVDIPNKRLTLEYGKKFVKDYPFEKAILPKGRGSRKTVISAVEAQVSRGRTVKATSDLYLAANKVIVLKKPLLEIVGDDYKLDDVFQGVVLKRSQVEELKDLLRAGNLVEIRY